LKDRPHPGVRVISRERERERRGGGDREIGRVWGGRGCYHRGMQACMSVHTHWCTGGVLARRPAHTRARARTHVDAHARTSAHRDAATLTLARARTHTLTHTQEGYYPRRPGNPPQWIDEWDLEDKVGCTLSPKERSVGEKSRRESRARERRVGGRRERLRTLPLKQRTRLFY
jgi:hypothetical protein